MYSGSVKNAKIKVKIANLSQNRIDITFSINEGNKTKIKGIKIVYHAWGDKKNPGILKQ